MKILGKIRRIFKSDFDIAKETGLNVGENVTCMSNVVFGSEPYLITLHDDVRISFNVSFITHDGGTWAFRDQEKYKSVIKYGKIEVGQRTFIGANSTIMPGVTIGKRCVIGAGSVVTKDVPNGMVVCGVPAKIIMTTEEYADKCYSSMKDYDEEQYLKNKKEYLLKWL